MRIAHAKYSPGSQPYPELTEREEMVLRFIVQHYIHTAAPVGSSYLSKRLEEASISPATIRNVMAELEEKGFLTHPHTSAGRIPTDLGYRLFVDELLRIEKLTREERTAIERQINPAASPNVLMRETSKLLAAISDQLGIVTAPAILNAVLERLELVPLSSTRILVVLSLQAGLVRTITIEVWEEASREQLDAMATSLNERLAGLTLREIRGSVRDRIGDLSGGHHESLVRLFIDAADQIFVQGEDQRLHISSTGNMLRHPEFNSPEQMRDVVQLIENEEVIIHLLEECDGDSVEVIIGRELGDERMAPYSVIRTPYRIGNTAGTIAVFGPKRMNYSKVITVVEYVARTISGGTK